MARRYTKAEINDMIADFEGAAARIDEGYADAVRAAADQSLHPSERALSRRLADAHRKNAADYRTNAQALRDGVHPDEL